ncbi:hypothetical protein IMZ48_40610 [Candidatus Bathyarchaeota archaeon]|nr:hypothetical protein [Candidatus Bathyarchaeota archaeon]
MIQSDRRYRKCSFRDLRYVLPYGWYIYGEEALRTALTTLGYRRRVRKRVIHLTQRHKDARYA